MVRKFVNLIDNLKHFISSVFLTNFPISGHKQGSQYRIGTGRTEEIYRIGH